MKSTERSTTAQKHISNLTTSMVPTSKLAEFAGIKPESIRHALSLKGHYQGLRPTKLPNGRLMWPLDQYLALLEG